LTKSNFLLSPYEQSRNLVSVAFDRGPEGALAWLRTIYSVSVADIRFVAEVYGLQIEHQQSLSNGVALMPLEHLPLSANASALIAQFQTIPPPSHRPTFPPIGATLVVSNVKASSQPNNVSIHRDKLERSIKAFTLVNEARPVIGIVWFEFVDPDPALADFGRMWSMPMYEGTVSPISRPQVDDAALAEVERYLLLSDNIRKICDVAIDRLNLARRRRSPGDQAIEGAICLEALLGDNDNRELTYKLRLRSALLLETTLENRRQVKKAVDRFYNLRSRTVHGRSHHDDHNDHQIAKEGLTICARVLGKIVERNEMPVPQDWELKGGV
jgi:Apea-like HEPN